MGRRTEADLIHAFAPSHRLMQAITTREAEDLERLRTCAEFARPLSAFEWQGFGHEPIGKLVVVVQYAPTAKGVRLEIYRRPPGFSRLSEPEKVKAARRMKFVKVRYSVQDDAALNATARELGWSPTAVRVHFDD